MTRRLPTALLPMLVPMLAVCFATSCARQGELTIPNQNIEVGTSLAADQELNRHIEADPRSLDPSLATDVVGALVLYDLGEGLVTVDQAGAMVPGVATSWDISPDGMNYTFHLRPNAKWSNGAPVTANDFVYGWQRQVDPKTASENSQSLAPIQNAMEIATGKMPPDRLAAEAMDPQTLVVHLHQPTAYFLSLLSNSYLFPIYQPAVKQWGDAWTEPGHMVTNGPFQLSERVLGGHITLTKNPYYWDAGNVRLTKVTYHVVEDNSSTDAQYLAGNLDFTDRVNLPDKDLLQRSLGDQVVFSPMFATAVLDYNLAKPPFLNNPKLRLALSMAVDRDILVKYVMRGVGLPAYTLVPALPGYDQSIPDWARLPDDQRHALARQLYHEAGYSDAHPLQTTVTYATGGPGQRIFFEALAAMWQTNLGAKVELYNVEWKVFLQERTLKQPLFFWAAWEGEYFDPFTFLQMYETGNAMNTGDYHNTDYEKLVNQGTTVIDTTKRYELFRQSEEILNNEEPFLPLYFYMTTHLIKPYVKGWKTNSMDRNLSRYMYILEHRED